MSFTRREIPEEGQVWIWCVEAWMIALLCQTLLFFHYPVISIPSGICKGCGPYLFPTSLWPPLPELSLGNPSPYIRSWLQCHFLCGCHDPRQGWLLLNAPQRSVLYPQAVLGFLFTFLSSKLNNKLSGFLPTQFLPQGTP